MELRYSTRAARDIDKIAAWSVRHFGVEQTARYLAGLREACGEAALEPRRGRVHHGGRNLQRVDYVSHVIFYRTMAATNEVIIIRILHKHQLPERHRL